MRLLRSLSVARTTRVTLASSARGSRRTRSGAARFARTRKGEIMDRNALERAREIQRQIDELEALLSVPAQRDYRQAGTMNAEHDRVMNQYRRAYQPIINH